MWIGQWRREMGHLDPLSAAICGNDEVMIDRPGEGQVRNNKVVEDILEQWRKFKLGYHKVENKILKARILEDEVFDEEGRNIGNRALGKGRYRNMSWRVKEVKLEQVVT
jgi:hypothetical protein